MIIGLYSSQPRQGKDTVANFIEKYYGFTKVSLATPIKEMIKTMLYQYFDETEVHRILADPRYKDEKPLPVIGVTLRHLYQTLGTEWGRICVNPDLWLMYVLRKEKEHGNIVVSDMRFPNEFDAFDLRIKVVRESKYNYDHDSEGRLENEDFDFIILNGGTLTDLEYTVNSMMNQLSNKLLKGIYIE